MMNLMKRPAMLALFVAIFLTTPVHAGDRYGLVYWSTSSGFQRTPLPGGAVETFANGATIMTGMAIDSNAGKIYWVDASGDAVRRANLDGTSVQDLVTTDLNSPLGIALDVRNGKMYWIDGVTSCKIERANLDGSSRETIVPGITNGTRAIAFDPVGQKVYWAQGTTGPRAIRRANPDGTSAETIVTLANTSIAQGVAVDSANKKVYWSELSSIGAERIRRANLDGTSIEDLVSIESGSNLRHITLDVPGGKMYFVNTNGNNGAIYRANLNGSDLQTIASPVNSNFGTAVVSTNDPTRTGDINGDGTVGVPDLLAVIANWG